MQTPASLVLQQLRSCHGDFSQVAQHFGSQIHEMRSQCLNHASSCRRLAPSAQAQCMSASAALRTIDIASIARCAEFDDDLTTAYRTCVDAQNRRRAELQLAQTSFIRERRRQLVSQWSQQLKSSFESPNLEQLHRSVALLIHTISTEPQFLDPIESLLAQQQLQHQQLPVVDLTPFSTDHFDSPADLMALTHSLLTCAIRTISKFDNTTLKSFSLLDEQHRHLSQFPELLRLRLSRTIVSFQCCALVHYAVSQSNFTSSEHPTISAFVSSIDSKCVQLIRLEAAVIALAQVSQAQTTPQKNRVSHIFLSPFFNWLCCVGCSSPSSAPCSQLSSFWNPNCISNSIHSARNLTGIELCACSFNRMSLL